MQSILQWIKDGRDRPLQNPQTLRISESKLHKHPLQLWWSSKLFRLIPSKQESIWDQSTHHDGGMSMTAKCTQFDFWFIWKIKKRKRIRLFIIVQSTTKYFSLQPMYTSSASSTDSTDRHNIFYFLQQSITCPTPYMSHQDKRGLRSPVSARRKFDQKYWETSWPDP